MNLMHLVSEAIQADEDGVTDVILDALDGAEPTVH